MCFMKHSPCYLLFGLVAVFTVGLGTPSSAQTPPTGKPESKEQTASGTFVSYTKGTLTIKSKSGLHSYQEVGANYKTFQNNETGAGCKSVETVEALNSVTLGMVFQVNVETREITYGLDYRVLGKFESYKEGKLILQAAEAPTGFVKKPTGTIELTIEPSIPILESVMGGDYKYAGSAGEFLKTITKGTMVTARSEYDPETIEVLQIGEAKRQMERYVGQTRGTVRGTFVSFKNGILRIRGRGVTTLAANEYDRVIAARVTESLPIVESIDGGAYKPTSLETLSATKEGTVITIRKIEEIVLEVQIGIAKQK